MGSCTLQKQIRPRKQQPAVAACCVDSDPCEIHARKVCDSSVCLRRSSSEVSHDDDVSDDDDDEDYDDDDDEVRHCQTLHPSLHSCRCFARKMFEI